MAAVLQNAELNLTTTVTFIHFPLLPLELRLKIWHHTFSPRILQYQLASIHLLGITTPVPGDPICYHGFGGKPYISQAPPMALQVCHESRAYALENYIPSLSSTAIPVFLQDYPDIPPQPVYYNPKIDVVAFEDLQYVLKWLEDPDFEGHSAYGSAPAFQDVRRLLLSGSEWKSAAELLSKYLWRATKLPRERLFTDHFTSLEEIWIVQNFRRGRRRVGPPGSVGLRKDEVLRSKQSLQRYLSGLWSQIPERRVPIVKAVLSMDDTTEVVADDEFTDR